MNFPLTNSNFFPSSNPKLSNPTSPTSKSTSESFVKKEEEDDTQQYDPQSSSAVIPEVNNNLNEDFLQNFLQRRDYIIKKMTQIYQNTKDEKARIIKLRRLIFIKPMIHEAISIQNLLKNTESDFLKFILKDLTNDIELSFHCVQNLQDFCQAQQYLPQADLMIQTSHMIESTWQQIYKLPIYDPVLIRQVSRLEWIFRAMDVLSHSKADEKYPYVEHCALLKKAAIESQNQEMMESQFYRQIDEELQKFKNLTQKVTLLYKHERGQAEDIQKMNVQEVNELLRRLKEFGFGMKQEIAYVEGILTKTGKIEATAERYLKFFHQRGLASSNDLKKLMQQIKKFPVRFPRIEEHVEKYFRNQKEKFKAILQETAQRILEGNKEMHQKFVRIAEKKTIKNGTMIPEAEEIWRFCGQEVQRITDYSEKLIQDLHSLKFEDFYKIRQQLTKMEFEHIYAELWLAQMRLLQIFCETTIKPVNPISFEELRAFLSEMKSHAMMKDYVESLPYPKRAPFDEQIDFLKFLIHRIKASIKEERSKLIKSGKALSNKIFYTFIDITKEVTKYVHQQPVYWGLPNPTGLQFEENQPQFIESLNRKRNSDQMQEIESCEKIEKKIKSREIYQLVFPSKSQPVIVRIETPDNTQNCLQNIIQQRPKIQKFEEKKASNDLNDWNNKENFDPNKVNEKAIEISEKMKKPEEYFHELNNEGLFDESFVFEDFDPVKPDLDRISYLDRLNEELWGDLDKGYKLKKKKKENLTNAAQERHNMTSKRN